MSLKCRACRSEDTQLLFFAENTHGRQFLSDEKFGIYKCGRCKVAFVDIDVNAQYYINYYEKDYYEKQVNEGLLAKIIRWLEQVSDKFRLGLIKKSGVTQGKILEIGCAKGRFLHSLPDCFDKYGIEINKEGYEYIKRSYSDINIFKTKLSSNFISENGCFEAIVMWHVFEHIDNPDQFAGHLKEALKDKGVVIFDVPNEGSIGFALTKRNWFHLDAPRHLFYYNCASLKKLFQKHGFTLVHYGSNPVDYFQDLLASVYMKIKRNNAFLDFFLLIFISPFLLLARFFCALFMPNKAEINTYVFKK